MANVMLEERQEATPRVRARVADLSILIVTWNSERWIDRCLRSIPAACEGLDYEVMVHDNASIDGTLGHIQDANILQSGTNDGFAAGINRAFAASRGRYVFLLNPDCELAPRTLTRLFEFLEAHPTIAAAVPLLSDESGDSQRNFQLRRLPTLGTFAAEVLMLDKLFPRNPATASYRYHDLDLTEAQHIEQPAAAALLLRREVVEEIGPMDEQFAPAWFEDVDYCRRLAHFGKEVWVVPGTEVRHFGGASLEHIHFSGFTDIWYRNMWRYARKWMRPRQAETLRVLIMIGMLLRCLVGLVGLRPSGIARREAFRAYSGVLKRAFHRWEQSPSSS